MKKKLIRVLQTISFLSLLFLCSCNLIGTKESKTAVPAVSNAAVSEVQPRVYATTLSTGFSVTGQKHSVSALFYQSPNSGAQWDFLGRPNNRIFTVAFFKPAKGKILAMATHTGVQQSNDYGKTWKTTSGWDMTEVNDVVFDPNDSNIIYASSPYGFYKTTDGGKKIALFTIATNRYFKTADWENKSEAEFHNCVAWGTLADRVDEFLKKGKLVYAEGRLKTRVIEKDDWLKLYKTEIVVSNLIFLNKKSDFEESESIDDTDSDDRF